MSTEALFNSIQHSALGEVLGKADPLVGALSQLIHIAGLLLILSAVVLVNLRLLGFGLKKQSLPGLVKTTTPQILYGLGLLVLSGLFIFIPSATIYLHNTAFWTKFSLLAIVLVIQFTLFRKVASVEHPKRSVAILTAATSLVLWFGVAFAGRIIGFI
jgi:hypothetical protein